MQVSILSLTACRLDSNWEYLNAGSVSILYNLFRRVWAFDGDTMQICSCFPHPLKVFVVAKRKETERTHRCYLQNNGRTTGKTCYKIREKVWPRKWERPRKEKEEQKHVFSRNAVKRQNIIRKRTNKKANVCNHVHLFIVCESIFTSDFIISSSKHLTNLTILI